MAFEINGSAPPDGAKPVGKGYRLILPEATGRSGTGALVGAVGKARLEITFESLSQAGWAWWAAFTGEAPSATLTSVKLWNDWKATAPDWELWSTSARIHRPTYDSLSGGIYYGVKVVISDLVK